MVIHTNDIKAFASLLQKTLSEGNTWLAYNAGEFNYKSQIHFFKSEEEAEDFCINNYSDHDRYSGREIQPLYNAIQQRIEKDKAREDIDYYYVYSTGEISVNLKQDPDRNPLYNSEGNDFTDGVIDFWEKKQVENSQTPLTQVNDANLQVLLWSLKSDGIEDLSGNMPKHMAEGSLTFELHGFKGFGEDTVEYKFTIQQTPDDLYSIAGYKATLYHPVLLNVKEVNGVDIEQLEGQMKNAKWDVDKIESYDNWKKAYREIEQITNSLLLISHSKEGGLTAVQLWNTHALVGTIAKPPFIERIEKAADYFPAAAFHADVSLDDAYMWLRPKAIENKLSVYPIAELLDKQTRAALIDKLAEDGSAFVKMEIMLIPANVIEKYSIVEHAYPTGLTYETGHSIKKLATFETFEEATIKFSIASELMARDAARLKHELMLVGEFRGKKLTFTYDGEPEKNTGLVMNRFLPAHPTLSVDYSLSIDPYKEVAISEYMYVGLDCYSSAVEFASDISHLKEIDRDFWNCMGQKGRLSEQIHFNRPELISNEIINNKNLSVMNQENLDYLKNSMKFSGFGDKLNAEIEKNIRLGVPEFVINDTTEFHNRRMESALHFRKGEKNEMYFFNSFDATLKRGDGTSESQRFYINKGNGFTLKEAANLMDGRAVYKEFTNKENEQYIGWKQLDFSQKDDNGNSKFKTFHENYGFNLEKALSKLPISELKEQDQKDALIRSLQKGNLQAVTFSENGNNARRFLAADPENRGFKIYDEKGVELKQDVKTVKLATSNGQEKTNSNNKDGQQASVQKTEAVSATEDVTDKSKKNSNKKEKSGVKDDTSLLEKKQGGRKKGLGV